MIFYVIEVLEDWNVDVPSWKYPRNLESPRVSSPGFGNDSKMMVMLVFNTKHFKVVASFTSTIFVFGEDTSAIRKLDRCLQECEYGNCREDAFNSTKLLDSQLAVLNDLRYVRSVADLGIEQAREE
ncbi:uncharacterized protein TNCV_4701701 [Trichonephila clavipes]|uniref:Uncharacterized protein n=1 Tax=Trichonephila clavipes TaxID=2585209 RepID=A0A8X6WGW2_TRICX|nr:uncharacterized protein TNCV_4701701 [Trichonephila clavipes]